jgi:hypothetical protein
MDKIGELWAEVQKTEERLRTVGGGIAAPALDCFVQDTPHDPFQATVFTALSDADTRSRIAAERNNVAGLVAAVVADIDGRPSAGLSALFGKSRAQLMPMAEIEGPHSQWIAAERPAPAAQNASAGPQGAVAETPKSEAPKTESAPSEPAAPKPADILAARAAIHKSRQAAETESAADAVRFVRPKVRKSGGLTATSDALFSDPTGSARVIEAPEVDLRKLDELGVPEPRADRDGPAALRIQKSEVLKKIKKKKPLWLKILWG